MIYDLILVLNVASFSVVIFYSLIAKFKSDNIALPKMNLPPISVLICTYNGQRTIGKCLFGLCQQSVKIKEVIVVDDNSTDRTRQICNRFKKRLNLKIVTKHGKRGLVSSKLQGLRHVKTKYVAILDSDGVLDRNALKAVFTNLLVNKALFSLCLSEGAGSKTVLSSITASIKAYREEVIQKGMFLSGVAIPLKGYFYVTRKSLLRKYIKDSFVDDLAITLQIADKKNAICLVPRVLVKGYQKKTMTALINQLTRWRIGNLALAKKWFTAILKATRIKTKLGLLSLFVIWYTFPLSIVANLLLSPFDARFLILFVTVYIYLLLVTPRKGSVLGFAAYPMVWSALKSFTILGALYLIFRRKSYYFEAPELYS